jgi:hypothetical protein
MSDSFLPTISSVTTELVTRGIPRKDGDSVNHGWTVYSPGPSYDVPSLTVALIPLSTDKPNGIYLRVCSCECCDAIVFTEINNRDGEVLATLSRWPGLAKVLRLADDLGLQMSPKRPHG